MELEDKVISDSTLNWFEAKEKEEKEREMHWRMLELEVQKRRDAEKALEKPESKAVKILKVIFGIIILGPIIAYLCFCAYCAWVAPEDSNTLVGDEIIYNDYYDSYSYGSLMD